MKNYLFLINPVSGGRAGETVYSSLKAALLVRLPAGSYDIAFTKSNFTDPVKKAAAAYRAIIIAGGDGSVFQAVQALAEAGAAPALGIIPIGTGNDLARSLGALSVYADQGIPGIVDMLLQGETAALDVLALNDRIFFTNYFGIGIDAKIAGDFAAHREAPLLRRLSALSLNKILYAGAGIKNLFYRTAGAIHLTAAGNRQHTVPAGACQVLITNIKTYAGGALLSSACSMQDSTFEATVVRTPAEWLLLHCSRLSGKPFNTLAPGALRLQTDRLEITACGRESFQIDGEPWSPGAGDEKITISVKGQIKMIVPGRGA